MTALPHFVSHKRVQAAPIVSVFQDGRSVAVRVGERVVPIQVPKNFFGRGTPLPGDYLVEYEDGYLSFSTKKAFEEGYAPEAPQDPIAVAKKLPRSVVAFVASYGAHGTEFELLKKLAQDSERLAAAAITQALKGTPP